MRIPRDVLRVHIPAQQSQIRILINPDDLVVQKYDRYRSVGGNLIAIQNDQGVWNRG